MDTPVKKAFGSARYRSSMNPISSVLIVDRGLELLGPKGTEAGVGSSMGGGLLTVDAEAGDVRLNYVLNSSQLAGC